MKAIPLHEFRVGDSVVLVLFGEDRVCRVTGRVGSWVTVMHDYGAPPATGGPQTLRIALPSDTPARALLS